MIFDYSVRKLVGSGEIDFEFLDNFKCFRALTILSFR